MKSYPAVGWKVGYVNRYDAEHPDRRRPARVLLQREGMANWLLPVSGDHLRLYGYVLPEDTFEIEPEKWVRYEGSPSWVLGKSPVVTSTTPLTLEFVDPLEATRRRRTEASDAILAALVSSRGESLLDRVSDLEHADRILSGNPVSVAALLALSAEEASIDAPELDSPERLRERLISVAPSGLDKLLKEMQKPGFELVRADRKLRDALLTAASAAFSSTSFVSPGKWASLRSTTLWRWWLSSKMAAEKAPLPRMASSLKLPLKDLEALARGDAPSEEILARLPSASDALAELTKCFEASPDLPTVAFIAEAHQPRLDLMVAQMGELERWNDSGRLVAWEKQREPLRDIAAQMVLQEDGVQWMRARVAADRARREVFHVGPEEPIPLSKLLEGVAARLLAIGLPFDRLLGEWAVGLGAPVVALGQYVLARDVGVLRFAVAHQIGHLLDSIGHATASRCAFISGSDYERAETDPGEAFANAFAAYLLAPADAVLRLVEIPSSYSVEWHLSAARDAASVFGLSIGLSLHHVLNCLRSRTTNVNVNVMECVQQARAAPVWVSWRAATRDAVENVWTPDRVTAEQEVGELPGTLDPLGRPRSAFFDRLVSEAVSGGIITPEVAAELNAA